MRSGSSRVLCWRFILPGLALFLFLSFAVWAGAHILRAENQLQHIRLDQAELAEDINRMAALRVQAVRAVAASAEVVDLLAGITAVDNPGVRLVLNTANAVAASELIWVMGKDGVVRSSSDYKGGTLAGVDYGFRPYFKGAMRGQEVVFPAFGAKTRTRGLYLSAPVYGDAQASEEKQEAGPIGVAALKIGIEAIDKALVKSPGLNLLVSPDGVIFASSRPEWLFKTLNPIPQSVNERFARTRQFGDKPLEPLGFELHADKVVLDGVEQRVLRRSLMVPGWSVLTLREVDASFPLTVQQRYLLVGMLTVFGGLIVLSVMLASTIYTRKAMEMALRTSEEKHRALFETAMEGMFQSTPEGRFLSVNPALARLLGYDSPEAVLQEIRHIPSQLYANPQDRELFVRELQENGEISGFEVQLLRRDGKPLWGELSARMVPDAHGEKSLFQGFILDISSRRIAQKELERLNETLEQRIQARTSELEEKAYELEKLNVQLSEMDRLKSFFLSSVSHELRTPLTSMLGFAKLISRDFRRHFKPLAEDGLLEQRASRILENLQILESEGERLTRLINNVLDLNKIESGHMEWHDRRLDVHEVLEQALAAFQVYREQQPDLEFDVSVCSDLPCLVVDPDRIVQVLLNLLHNAYKFTVEGGVSLSVNCAEGYAENGESKALLVEVRDTGVGIGESQLESVFEHFKQLHGDTIESIRKGGSGLGLPICKHIVEHYGGRIWAESEPGKGSRFFFTLPL